MADIVGVIQVKGGVGRSTIATNLAAILSAAGPTTLIDCDLPQGTSASWYATRESGAAPGNLTLALARDHVELVDKAAELNETQRFIIIDAPPRIAALTRAIIILSRLSLIPLGASAAEIWSTADLLQTLADARKHKQDVDARIVWNRFRAYTREAQELSEAVRREMKLKELDARLGYRVAYSEALARGLSVAEWPDKTAQEEMTALVDEVRGILGGKS
ncbi:MAG TPA: ParA family protein [Geobacteraceae bacterium]|nr:ParA family protein [Geobacteraceae bacterium]